MRTFLIVAFMALALAGIGAGGAAALATPANEDGGGGSRTSGESFIGWQFPWQVWYVWWCEGSNCYGYTVLR